MGGEMTGALAVIPYIALTLVAFGAIFLGTLVAASTAGLFVDTSVGVPAARAHTALETSTSNRTRSLIMMLGIVVVFYAVAAVAVYLMTLGF